MPARGDFAPDKSLPKMAALAVGIGIIATFVAAGLYHLIGFFTNLFFLQRISFSFVSPAAASPHWIVLVVPAVGGLIVGLIARFGSEQIRGHGIPEALEAILFGKSRMSPKIAVLKPLSSAIAIGSGGPFGAEGPIIMTGGAFGSLIGQVFYLTAAERRILLVAGASAGMAAIFATPIAATILAVELLLFEWRPRSVIPVGIACFVASAFRPLLFEPAPLFPVPATFQVGAVDLGMAVVAGAFAALVAAFLTMAVYKAEDSFARLPIHWMWWPALGGIVVGIGGYFVPEALGVGYGVIEEMLNGHVAAASAGLLLLVKGLIWAVALGSGTSGGVLAPLLMIGAGLGTLEAAVFPGHTLMWPLVSMGAVLGGVMRSPFTAVIFCLELTANVSVLPPLFIACLVAYGLSVYVMKRSILTEKVVRRGRDIFREYSVDLLERLPVREVMTTDVVTISDRLTLRQVREDYFGPEQRHRGYPVVDHSGALVGSITREDLTELQRVEGALDKPLADLPTGDVAYAFANESCRTIATRLAVRKLDRLAVVAHDGSQRLLGVVTRHDLLKPSTRHFHEEHARERFYRPLLRSRRPPG